MSPYIFIPCLSSIPPQHHFAELAIKGFQTNDQHNNVLPVGIELVDGIHAGAGCAAAVLGIL